jgi:hypothetical protein
LKRFFIWAPVLTGLVFAALYLSRPAILSQATRINTSRSAEPLEPSAYGALKSSPTPQAHSYSNVTVLNGGPASVAVPTNGRPTAFDTFDEWARRFTNGTGNLVEGERRAWRRREAMEELIQTDPAKALALAVPFTWRRALPAAVTSFFEEPVDGRGDFKVAIATEFDKGQSTVTRTVELGTNRYQAFVYGRRLTQSCQNSIPLHGIALGGKMAVQAEPIRLISPEEAIALSRKQGHQLEQLCGVSGRPANSRNQPVYGETGGGILCFCGTDHYDLANRQRSLAESGTGAFGSTGVAGVGGAPSEAWTHGPKSLLYLRVNFPDDLSEPISEEAAYSAMDGVNDFYVETSYDLTSLETTVTPLLTLPQSKAWYATTGPGQLQVDARETARLAGYDTTNYDRDIVAFTPVPGYTFGGLAYVGGKGVWLQSMGSGVTAHELGHNYGLWHANFWDTTTNGSMIGPGTNLEYGNIYDTMGAAAAGAYQFNAAHKTKLDWLNADAVQVISTNGVYRVYPFDVPDWKRVAGRSYAAAVQKDFMRYYWLEFRQLFTENPWQQNGVLLNWAPWPQSNGGTQLIDTTPGSPTRTGDPRDDAALVVGRTFNDNPAGVHITPVARGVTGTDPWLEVQVNLGTFPGNEPPELHVELDQTNIVAGGLVHFHAATWDSAADTLAYSWTFDDLSFSTNNLPWISKTFSTPGDHVVRCVVSDMKGGEASANAIVTVGGPAGYRVSGHVFDNNGLPVQGVLVSNGATSVPGFLGGWTDSHGQYVIANVTGDLTLNAFEFGYTLTGATNWSNPITPTSDLTDIDFIATPLTTVNITVDTNVVAKTDGSTHYFTLTRIGDTNNDLTVALNLSGTAISGTDFTLNPNQTANPVTIPAGSYSVPFAFQALNSRVTGPLTATLTVVDDVNFGSPAYALAPPAIATITILGNDNGGSTVTVTTLTPAVTENGTDDGQFVFTRSGNLQGDLVVNYSVTGTATPGGQYPTLPGVALIPSGQSSVTVAFQPRTDTRVGADETVIVNVLPEAAYTVGNPASATVSILEQDFTSVTISPTAQATKPSQAGSFTVQREGDLTDNLVVFLTVGGTATPGSDYTTLPASVTIPAGAASTEIPVLPLHNSIAKGDVSVTVSLTNDFNYDVGTPGGATVWIHDDHLPTISISAPLSSLSEQGDTIGQFKISRGTTAGDLTVYLAISGSATPGADYLPLNNTVVIPNGASSANLDVIGFRDLIQEITEDVVLTVQANSNYNVGLPATARVNIADDGTSQVPGIGFTAASSSVLESQSPGIAVGLSITSQVPIMVDYQVSGGTAPSGRYSLPPGTLTINAGDLVAFIPLQIIDDAVVEPPQTIQVVLRNPIGAALDAIKVHTYTILDDDANSVSVAATVANASESGTPGNFRIARAGPTSASQVVNYQVTGTASAPTDYATLGNSVTIPAGATFVDLPVMPAANRTVDPGQTVVVTLTTAPGGKVVSPNQATVTIGETNTNPLPIVVVTSTNQPYAMEGGANGGFIFTRTGPATGPLTLNFTTTGTATSGVRYQALPNSISIPAGQTSVVLPVLAIDDKVVKGEETVILWLTDNETYRVAYPASATVTIQDNDQRVWIDASDFYSSKYGPELGGFTFSRSGTTNTPVTIRYAISGTAINGVDCSTISNAIVIPAGSPNATLPIVPLHTGKVQGPVTLTLTLLSDPGFQLATPTNATVTIDDDMPMVRIFGVVTNVLEGSGSNGVFRIIRTGDPKFDFTAHLAVGGAATYGVDYPGFATNVYFTCGVTSIDLFITPTNELAVEGDENVTARLVPDPAYTILSPSNAEVTIGDAGTDQTPVVTITSPVGGIAFVVATNLGLVLNATVVDDQPSNALTFTWTVLDGPPGYNFSSTNTPNTTIFFTNAGMYLLRLTVDDGQLQGFADVRAIVTLDWITATNLLDWTFDDGVGTNALDSSGFGRDGQLAGAPIWITNGILGGALNFSGNNEFVRQVRQTNFLNGLDQFTLSMWIQPASSNLAQGFFSASDSGTNQTLSLSTHSFASCGTYTNVFEFNLPTTRGVAHHVSGSGLVQPLEWQQVSVTWSNGLAPALYINGQLDQPFSGFAPIEGRLTNCFDFIIGKGSPGADNPWNGAIDDVHVFSRALSPDIMLAMGNWPVTNHAPFVNAGSNVTVQTTLPVTLAGNVSDDGLPNPPGQITTTWTYLGTNNVTIPDPSSLTNTLVFTDPGDYLFQLTADDGQAATFALVTVTVILPTEVDVSASIPEASELGPAMGQFTITRIGDTNDLTVYLAFSGSSTNGVDYTELPTQVTFPAGTDTLTLDVVPFLEYAIEGDQSAILTVVTNIAYSIGNGQATVVVHDSPYGVWSVTNFTLQELTHPELSGPGADFNHDGIQNFVEYALNLDPKATNSVAPFGWGFETDTNDGLQHLTITYTRRLSPRDVQYGLFVSTDLQTWNTGTNWVEEFFTSPDTNGFTETVKSRALQPFPNPTNLFMNLRVWLEQVP